MTSVIVSTSSGERELSPEREFALDTYPPAQDMIDARSCKEIH